MNKLFDLFWRGKIKNSLLAGFLLLALALIAVTITVSYHYLNIVMLEAAAAVRAITIAAVLVIIAFLPVVMLVARKISYPLEVLSEVADEIARGNYGVTLNLGANRETNTLAVSFNRMSMKLKEQREVLLKQIALLKRRNRKLPLKTRNWPRRTPALN